MHPVIVLADGLRYCHCSHTHSSGGSSLGDYLILGWLWRQIGWWSLLVYTAFVVACGFIRAAFGGGDDC